MKYKLSYLWAILAKVTCQNFFLIFYQYFIYLIYHFIHTYMQAVQSLHRLIIYKIEEYLKNSQSQNTNIFSLHLNLFNFNSSRYLLIEIHLILNIYIMFFHLLFSLEKILDYQYFFYKVRAIKLLQIGISKQMLFYPIEI